MKISISIIVPFYQGNKYMSKLLDSISCVAVQTSAFAEYEIILVNDSPWVEIELPKTNLKISIYKNEKNCGIQYSRVKGLNNASGDWVLFLDQDDELVTDGFKSQINLTQCGDVVVGNGVYNLGSVCRIIYKDKHCMDYLIQEKNFIKIRNLIASPGQCLIKRSVFPSYYSENLLKTNGADDWYLWLLLFKSGCKFICNPEKVYIHNDTAGENLSANLNIMRSSALEVKDLLEYNSILSKTEGEKLKHAIEFKYYQDTKSLNLYRLLKYSKPILDNCIYKLNLFIR